MLKEEIFSNITELKQSVSLGHCTREFAWDSLSEMMDDFLIDETKDKWNIYEEDLKNALLEDY